MSVQIEIPDNVFQLPPADISRQILETVAIEGFKSGQLTTYQIRKMLGFSSRFEVHEFLAEHNVPWVDYTVEDAVRELELLQELGKQ